jgi:hypothetical protein
MDKHLEHALKFCRDFAGQTLDAMPGSDGKAGWRGWSYNFDKTSYGWTYVRADARLGCKFPLDKAYCEERMRSIAQDCYRWGGHTEDNCANWLLDPGSHMFEGGAPGGDGTPNP